MKTTVNGTGTVREPRIGIVTPIGGQQAMLGAQWTMKTFPYHIGALPTSTSNLFMSSNSMTIFPTTLNTSAVTLMDSMFYGCPLLTEAPPMNTGNVTSMGTVFRNCFALTTVPLYDTAKVTYMGSMFRDCNVLPTVPLFNTALVTNMSNMFQNCLALTTVPLFNTAAVTNVSSMFSGCTALTSIPALNFTSVTSATSVFSGCTALTSIGIVNMKETFSIVGTQLNAAAIDTLFTNLGTVTAKTITITGCPGAATCDRTIATLKGWTVTG
jgi:hypothetical protein